MNLRINISSMITRQKNKRY